MWAIPKQEEVVWEPNTYTIQDPKTGDCSTRLFQGEKVTNIPVNLYHIACVTREQEIVDPTYDWPEDVWNNKRYSISFYKANDDYERHSFKTEVERDEAYTEMLHMLRPSAHLSTDYYMSASDDQ